MKPNLRRFRTRIREKIASITNLFAVLLAAFKPKGRGFRSQRMCPFCGLITPRHKTCCLECGKSFKPA